MTASTRAAAMAAAGLLFCALQAAAGELKPWSGGPPPALTLSDTADARHSLADYRGRVVILNFWASWCEPCREEMPSLNRLKRAFAGKPVAVLAVNMGEGEGRVGEFLKSVPVEFPILLDRNSQVAKAWRVRLLPTTFIIGRDGRILYSYAGERDWADAEVRAKIGALLVDTSLRAQR